MTRILTLTLLLLVLNGCATALKGPTQEVTVLTPGAKGATCYLIRPGLRSNAYPPQTIRINKTKDVLKVHCVAPGNREKTAFIEPRYEPEAALNILNGILPGGYVDYENGSMFVYPNIITVDFQGVPSKPMPLPDYHMLIKDNPALASVEEFRPGKSALQSDMYEKVPTMERINRESAIMKQSADIADITGGSYTVKSGGTADGENGGSSQGSGSSATAAPSSGTSSSSSTGTGGSDGLTRQMNPNVFGSP